MYPTDNLPYEKVGKNEPVCIADEVPFEIPESWEWVRWGTLSESIQYGYNAPAQENGRIKMVRISDIQDNSVMWETVPYCDIKEEEIDAYLLKPNDILFARTGGTVGKSYLVQEVPEEAIYAGYLIRTRYSDQLCPQYLKYFMESELYWSQLREGTIATAQPNCNGKTLGNMLVPIPPAHEQIRIVEKLNAIMAHIIEYGTAYSKSKHLNNIFPEQLKKSILQEAVQGKLVPQDQNDEPASVLLERIRAEKQKLISEGKIKKDKHESVIFRRDNSHYEKLDGIERCIDDEIPFEIPANWEWARLGMISTYSQTKQKINVQNADSNMWGLDLEDIEKGGKLLDIKTVGERKAVGEKNLFYRGDILYSKLRPYLLKILVAPGCGICTPEIVPFKVFGSLEPEYIVAFLKCPYVDAFINAVTYGVKMPRVSTETMTNLLVPIPPLSEQRRIVEKQQELFDKITLI